MQVLLATYYRGSLLLSAMSHDSQLIFEAKIGLQISLQPLQMIASYPPRPVTSRAFRAFRDLPHRSLQTSEVWAWKLPTPSQTDNPPAPKRRRCRRYPPLAAQKGLKHGGIGLKLSEPPTTEQDRLL